MAYLQTYGLCMWDGVNSIKSSYERLEALKNQYNAIIEECGVFIQRTNSKLNSEEMVKYLGTTVRITQRPEDFNGEALCQSIINVLQNNVKKYLLNDFEQDLHIYREIAYLDPRNLHELMKAEDFDITDISLEFLCSLNDTEFNENLAAALCEFVQIFVNNQIRLEKQPESSLDFRNNVENLSDDMEFSPVCIDGVIEIQELTNCDMEPAINLQKSCYCIECILKNLNELCIQKKNIYDTIFKLYKFVAILPATQVINVQSIIDDISISSDSLAKLLI